LRLWLRCPRPPSPSLFGQSALQADNAMHGGELDVPLNKSQVLTVDRTVRQGDGR